MEYQKLSRKAIGCMLVNEVLLAVVLTAVLTGAAFGLNKAGVNIIPVVFGLILVLVWCISLAAPFVRYERYRYRFSEEDISVREGFLWIHRDIVPIERLHKVALESGPIDRIFGLSKVIVTTAGGDVTIRFLEVPVAEEITDRLKRRINRYAVSGRGENGRAAGNY